MFLSLMILVHFKVCVVTACGISLCTDSCNLNMFAMWPIAAHIWDVDPGLEPGG